MGLLTTTFQGSGEQLGAAVGTRFRDTIASSLEANAPLHGPFLDFHRATEGQRLYRRLVDLHQAHYPGFLDELRGTAHGAGVQFEHLFLVNLRGEYRGFTGVDDGGECSTCALLDDSHAVFGHNEDGAAIYRGQSYLIRVEPDDGVPFTALCYPGFLPGNAFGFNDYGLCFSVNNVRPRRVQEGLGRHFLARSLFGARDIRDAVARLSVTPRAAGFNFTLGSRVERRIVNVEVAPHAVDVRAVSGAHFHANHYLYLDTPQHRFPSSEARQRRGEELLARAAPSDARGVMRVLRDQGERDFPVWRDGQAPDEGVTLLSALFDLDRGTLRIYPGPWQRELSPDEPLAAAPIPGA
jgi:predicted choloylglycine hydrolase